MEPAFAGLPATTVMLAAALAVAGIAAVAARRRGGRLRGLPGWVGFWVVFSLILVALSRLPHWISLTMLGLMMFAALRTYFFLVPVRVRDRYAMLAAYVTIPVSLSPGLLGSPDAFLATMPVLLFLIFPVLLSAGRPHDGMLESTGRILIGVAVFVFGPAHLGLMLHLGRPGLIELFGVMVLAAELPGRLAGRFRQGGRLARSIVGFVVGALLAVAVGFFAGPWVGIVEEDGGRVGLLVALAVAIGSLVSEAVMHDLAPSPSGVRLGRWAFLDRAIPTVYAAPIFFHYLNHFA